jgi:hypothetical protein
MLFDQGQLEKMMIRAFAPRSSSDEPPQVSDKPEDTYVVQVNPNSYSLSQALTYVERDLQGSSGQEAVYTRTEPRSLQFEFLFDGTGVVPPPSALSDVSLLGAIDSALSGSKDFNVSTEIEKFNKIVSKYDGEIHRPRQLLLAWGTLQFPCVLTALTYRFTLFSPDGVPLRAVLECTFLESLTRAELAQIENASSPDLTHLQTVKEGDTLPLMSYRIYGKTDLYIEVARVNKLVNFRRLRSGTQLTFPPVNKEVK